MLVCKVLKAEMDRMKVESDINEFLSSMPLGSEDIKISQVVRNKKIITTIIYQVK